jgi:16S rRNA (uracil1498-N3)-methyltransferase
MQRYFVPPEQFAGNRVVLSGDDAHHAIRVMRMKAGDRMICSDGRDREALVRVSAIDKQSVEAEVLEWLDPPAEAAVDVWVAQSLPKGDKMETVIQKCTEIGAARFIPFLSERTIVQYDGKKEAKRLERWNKIAKEAAEQSRRGRIPQVDPPVSWKQLLQLSGEAGLALFCYEKEEERGLRDILSAWMGEPRSGRGTILLIIGPEGGFSEEEAEEAATAGCRPVRLGRRILRTETAAMVGLSCIIYESGEMGGT